MPSVSKPVTSAAKIFGIHSCQCEWITNSHIWEIQSVLSLCKSGVQQGLLAYRCAHQLPRTPRPSSQQPQNQATNPCHLMCWERTSADTRNLGGDNAWSFQVEKAKIKKMYVDSRAYNFLIQTQTWIWLCTVYFKVCITLACSFLELIL